MQGPHFASLGGADVPSQGVPSDLRIHRVLWQHNSHQSVPSESDSAAVLSDGSTQTAPTEPRREKMSIEYILQKLLDWSIWTGMVASKVQPRPEMVGLIEDFGAAGIRFAHFRQNRLLERNFLPKSWD